MNSRKWRTGACMSLCALLINACGGSSEEDVDGAARNANGSYLFVTHQGKDLGADSNEELYWADQNVGSTSSYAVRIANRGADVYPLKNISIEAPLKPTAEQQDQTQLQDNSEEFAVQIVDDIVLQPAEAVTVRVSFSPITQGGKNARLVVDYETIQKVDESVNVNEQSYYQANDMALTGRYRAASETFSDYLANAPVTSNKRRAAIRLPILKEAQTHASEEDLGLYLEAMSERDEQNYKEAIRKLDIFASVYSDSHLADDAQYLKGYIQLMDLNDDKSALRSMQVLRDTHPDTNYYDTSLYSEAIAQTELGNAALAEKILVELKQRHSSINVLGIELPKDNLMSRMWFERTTRMLNTTT